MDSHVWDVYVRGYGVSDNFHDLFTTLCNYIGADAFFTALNIKDSGRDLQLSFVRIKRGWVAFDPYKGFYFKNHTGGLATIEELIDEQDWHIIKLAQIDISKVSYEQYLVENLLRIEKLGSSLLRANTQSPINRLRLHLHKWFSSKKPLLLE
jgi:hypothetical protein